LLPQHQSKEVAVSRFQKLSHTIWHCQYHIVWVPKYRFRILVGEVAQSVESGTQAICGFAGCEVVELNVQKDHVHLLVMIPPKISVSDLMGRVKGQTAMKVFRQFRQLRKKPYWGNHFWAKGYCVDTVGLDTEMIRRYVKYQENKERQQEQLRLDE
jgi:putative transposase